MYESPLCVNKEGSARIVFQHCHSLSALTVSLNDRQIRQSAKQHCRILLAESEDRDVPYEQRTIHSSSPLHRLGSERDTAATNHQLMSS